MARWIVQEDRDGNVALHKDRKQVASHPSVAAGTRAAHSLMQSGDTLYHEAPDGYRTRLRGRRRGWRQTR